jgi:hypothetical protein
MSGKVATIDFLGKCVGKRILCDVRELAVLSRFPVDAAYV